MTTRLLLVLAALLAPPAMPQDFDLHGDAVRKIVQKAVSSQSALVQPPAPAPRDAAPAIRFVPAEKPPAPKKVAPPRPATARPAPSAFDGVLSTLFGAVVDNAVHESLGIDPGVSTDEQYEVWRACRAHEDKCLLPPAPPGSQP